MNHNGTGIGIQLAVEKAVPGYSPFFWQVSVEFSCPFTRCSARQNWERGIDWGTTHVTELQFLPKVEFLFMCTIFPLHDYALLLPWWILYVFHQMYNRFHLECVFNALSYDNKVYLVCKKLAGLNPPLSKSEDLSPKN